MIEKLTTQEINAVENKVLVGYSITPICNVPADYTGYDISSCDTSSGAINELSCNLSCADGYYSTGATSSCSMTGQDFVFSGCSQIFGYGTNYYEAVLTHWQHMMFF